MHRSIIANFSITIFILLLTACGGGGSDAQPPDRRVDNIFKVDDAVVNEDIVLDKNSQIKGIIEDGYNVRSDIFLIINKLFPDASDALVARKFARSIQQGLVANTKSEQELDLYQLQVDEAIDCLVLRFGVDLATVVAENIILYTANTASRYFAWRQLNVAMSGRTSTLVEEFNFEKNCQ